jgi:hypothetical protein
LRNFYWLSFTLLVALSSPSGLIHHGKLLTNLLVNIR